MTAKKRAQPKVGGDIITGTIGDNASQVAVGKDIRQQHLSGSSSVEVTQADLKQVSDLFGALRQQIEQQAPADKKAAALERVEELQAEIASKKPDLTTFDYVKSWFGKNIPGLLGGVTSLLINPILGKVVAAASGLAVDAIKRRFGGG